MKNEHKPEIKDEVGLSSTLPGSGLSSTLPGTRRPRNPDLSYCPILTFEEHHELDKNIELVSTNEIPYECPKNSIINFYLNFININYQLLNVLFVGTTGLYVRNY